MVEPEITRLSWMGKFSVLSTLKKKLTLPRIEPNIFLLKLKHPNHLSHCDELQIVAALTIFVLKHVKNMNKIIISKVLTWDLIHQTPLYGHWVNFLNTTPI